MIVYRSPSEEHLLLTDDVLARFNRYRQTGRRKEAGGQLFATFGGSTTQIERATGPRRSDRRGRGFFFPDRRAERREIERLFKSGLHYVGDWHTHPENRPVPSSTDMASFREMFCKSKHRLDSFVIIIVGLDHGPEGLYVGLCSGQRVVRLRPVQTDEGATDEDG